MSKTDDKKTGVPRSLDGLVRHHGFPVSDASRFAVKFSGPDGPWTASLEIEWTWLGRGHWHCFFFPWWPNG
jgi:hypothetical protein